MEQGQSASLSGLSGILSSPRYKQGLSVEEVPVREKGEVVQDSRGQMRETTPATRGSSSEMARAAREALIGMMGSEAVLLYENRKPVKTGDVVEISRSALFCVSEVVGDEAVLENVLLGKIKVGVDFFANCKRLKEGCG